MYDSMMIHRELVADTSMWVSVCGWYLSKSICLWVVSVKEYLSVGISVSVLRPKGGFTGDVQCAGGLYQDQH